MVEEAVPCGSVVALRFLDPPLPLEAATFLLAADTLGFQAPFLLLQYFQFLVSREPRQMRLLVSLTHTEGGFFTLSTV